MKYMKTPEFTEIPQQGYLMVPKLVASCMYFGELH